MTHAWWHTTAGGGGAATASSGDIPYEVLAALAQQSTDAADFERRKQEWLDQQAALTKLAGVIPAGWQQIDETHWYNPGEQRVYELRKNTSGSPTFDQYTAKDTAAFLADYGSGGASGSGGGNALGWAQLSQSERQHADALAAQYMNMGLDSESARRQAYATLIANRNNLASNTAQTSADIAKQIAEFEANPRNTYAAAIYRNQIGGATPFGDTNNAAFGEYGKALADTAKSIFQPVAADLNAARGFRDAPLPVDFTSASPGVQQLIGGTGGGLPASTAPAPEPNILQQMTDRLKAFSPQQQDDFVRYVTGGQQSKPVPMAKGGALNFDGMFDRSGPGYSPASSEGGSNLNLHERAVVVGESGHVYATLGEKRTDGTVRAEQLMIKPLKSEVDKDKKLEDANKAIVETQKQTMKSFAGGGTVTSPSMDDMNAQYSQLLERLGGSGGGSSTPYGGARFLAGAPANAILNDPFLQGVTEAGYSMRGIDPRQLWADVAKFTPQGPQNNIPRVSFA